MKTFFHLGGFLLLSLFSNAQIDYNIIAHFPEGVATISRITASPFKTETRYGLLDEKSNSVILDPSYKTVYSAKEPGLFIITDTTDKVGLFSIKKNFIISPSLKQIDPFIDGVAIVRAAGKEFSSNVFGAIDVSGKFIIPLEYDYLGSKAEGLFNFRSNGKYGFLDEKNEIVIPAKYSNAGSFRNGLAPAKDDNSLLYGYINKKDEFVIAPRYKNASVFYDGYAEVFKSMRENSKSGIVSIDDTVGVIDTKGKIIIPTIYNNISLKQDGVFVVTLGKKQGLYDSTGKLLMPLEEQTFGTFSGNHLGTFSKNKKWGVLTNRGVILLPAEYDYIYGMADYSLLTRKGKVYSVVNVNGSLKTIIPPDTLENFITGSKKYFIAIGKDEIKIYTRTGKLVKTVKQLNLKPFAIKISPNDDSLAVSYGKAIYFCDLASGKKTTTTFEEVGDFSKDGIATAQKENGFYFIDKSGDPINTKPYSSIVNFSEGIGGVQENETSSPYLIDRSLNKIAKLTTRFYGPYSEGLAKSVGPSNSNINYLDKKGNIAFTVNGIDGSVFKEGKTTIKDLNGNWYYVNRQGKTISKETYQNAAFFSEGLAAVEKNNKWGYIDSLGNVVIPFKFDGISPFFENAALVREGNDLFLISKKGEPINNEKYSAANDPANGSFAVKKGEKFGLIDSKGNVVILFNYENIFPLSEDVTWAMKNKKWGVIDKTGKEISSFIYDNVANFSNGYAIVQLNSKEGVVDKTGKVVVPIEYDQLSSVFDKHIILIKNEGQYFIHL